MNKMTNLKPVGHRILLRSEKVSNKREVAGGGRLYTMSDQQAEREEAGNNIHEVVAMGPDCFTDPDMFRGDPWCKAGDSVLTMKYPGVKFEEDDCTYWFCNDSDILGVVKNG